MGCVAGNVTGRCEAMEFVESGLGFVAGNVVDHRSLRQSGSGNVAGGGRLQELAGRWFGVRRGMV